MKKITNISFKHFKSILLPNPQNDDILNIYLFYRKDKFVTGKSFQDAINSLDFKKMILRLFCFSTQAPLTEFEREIVEFDFDNNFTEEEKENIKWLLYDKSNANGMNVIDYEIENNVIKKVKEKYFHKENSLFIYFTDIALYKKIQSQINNGFKLTFYEDEKPSNTLKYLKLQNEICFKKFSEFVLECNYNIDTISTRLKNEEIIDHIQKPPSYFHSFDFSLYKPYILSLNKTKNEKIKYLIYARIIEAWKSNLNIEDCNRPQFNNCFYNLKELDGNVNCSIKAKIIDRSNIIYPRRDMNNKKIFYITFYFPETQDLIVKNEHIKITALSVIYDFSKKDYKEIIEEINCKCLNFKQKVDFSKLLNYIKGKDILYIPYECNNITLKGIVATKDLFDENTEGVIKIHNYQL